MNTAEWQYAMRKKEAHYELQWSRRVNTAECLSYLKEKIADLRLQWSRRVNTAEWLYTTLAEDEKRLASMEPPCEHGGVLRNTGTGSPAA